MALFLSVVFKPFRQTAVIVAVSSQPFIGMVATAPLTTLSSPDDRRTSLSLNFQMTVVSHIGVCGVENRTVTFWPVSVGIIWTTFGVGKVFEIVV